MARVFLFNDSAAPKLMGGKLVPPGEGREVDEVHLPPGEAVPEGEPESQRPEPDRLANLRDLLAGPVKSIVPELPSFSVETLAELEGLELISETPRKGLLGAIADERLKRAQNAVGGPAT